MKRILLSVLVTIALALPHWASAQGNDFGFRIGAAYYLGDLSGTGSEAQTGPMNIQFSEIGFNIGANARTFISPAFAVQGELNWVRVRGADKHSEIPTHYSRNLSFRNDIVELAGRLEWHFFRLQDVGRTYRYKLTFSPYVFLGIAGFYHNPKADYNGSYVALRPLKTEGVDYSPISFAIPAGLGFEFKVDKKHIIGWEVTVRRTFTDYIDDVSTNYQHHSTFEDPTALALQDRSIELEGSGDPLFIGSQYYSYGSNVNNEAPRGNPDFKDYYMWTGVYYKYALREKRKKFNQRKYHFARRKVKRRRSRAKF